MALHKVLLKFIILVLSSVLTLPLYSQVTLFGKDSLNNELKSFSTENIGSETEKTQALIRGLWNKLETFSQRDKLDSLTRKRIARVEDYKGTVSLSSIERLDFRQVNTLRITMLNLRSELEEARDELGKLSSGLSSDRRTVDELIGKWERTLQQQIQENRPRQVIERIETNVLNLKSLSKELKRENNLLLTRQDEITGAVIFLDEVLTNIADVLELQRRQIYSTDSHPLWAVFSLQKDSLSMQSQLAHVFEQRKQSMSNHQRLLVNILLFYVLAFSVLLFALSYIRKKLKGQNELMSSPSIVLPLVFISNPVSSGVLLSSLLLFLFSPHIPPELNDVIRLILIIPILNILPGIWPHIPKRYFYLSALVFLLAIVMDFFGGFVVLNRLLMLVSGFLLAVVFVLFLSWRKANQQKTEESWPSVIIKVLYLGLMSVVMSILLNVIGNHYLSSILFYGVLTFIYGGLIIYSTSHLLKSIFELVVRHRLLVDLNIFKNYPDLILQWVFKIISFSAVALWVIISAKSYLVFDPVYDWLASLLTSKLHLGSVGISLGNILSFVITLTLTLYISRFIRFVLEDEVFTHLEMPRGVPGAITMMVRLTLLGFGFILAFGAAEIDISNITIIFGALGVGIGFGLQNIFNNLVSGLILAFERPIQVGDVLQISSLNLMGEVKEIGIRASVIRTFDGAEVVVPNGNLISNEMVNWTLSDRKRRQEIFIGVAYGTDLKQVLEILDKVVSAQEGVMKKPAPFIIFKGFGDSSLDFRILFWTHFDEGLITKSRVGVAIDNAFKEAGINIPFPQRDLHIIRNK